MRSLPGGRVAVDTKTERFELTDEAVAAGLARLTRVGARVTVPLFVGIGAMLGGPCGLGFGEPIGALIGVFAGAALGASGARITLGRQHAERMKEVAMGLIALPLLVLAGSVAASADPTTVAALAWAGVDFVLLATAQRWLPPVGSWLLRERVTGETTLYVREEGLETRFDGFVDHAPWSWIREVREHPTHALIRDGADHWYVFPKSATPDPEGLLAFVRARVVPEPPPVPSPAVPPPRTSGRDDPFAPPAR